MVTNSCTVASISGSCVRKLRHVLVDEEAIARAGLQSQIKY
jgi:bacterioferritin-associated ferredoxin